MADSDISFHGGTPAPDHPESYGWSSDNDGDDGDVSRSSYGHTDNAVPKPNPIAFGNQTT